jgi:hypothetical protein
MVLSSIVVTTIPNGSTSFSASANNSFQLNALDLITIQLTYNGGALPNGACMTLIVSAN